MSSSERRRWLQAALALAAAGLGGCGFELRRTPTMPFSSLMLQGFQARSPMAEQLRRSLQRSVQIVELPAQPDVVLQALGEDQLKVATGTTSAAQVNTFSLRVNFRFRAQTPSGRELIGATEIGLARDLSYSETLALAKESEENALFRAMRADIADQVLRRLASVHP